MAKIDFFFLVLQTSLFKDEHKGKQEDELERNSKSLDEKIGSLSLDHV